MRSKLQRMPLLLFLPSAFYFKHGDTYDHQFTFYAKEYEMMYAKERIHRREVERASARAREGHGEYEMQLNEVMEKLRVAQEQKLSLKGQLENASLQRTSHGT